MTDHLHHGSGFFSSQRGQSLVEFALMLPVLLLILLGAIDLGRAFTAYVAITNAAHEGARYGAGHLTIVDAVTGSKLLNPLITGATTNEALLGGITIDPAKVEVACLTYAGDSTIDCTLAETGQQIKVTVTFDFHLETLYLFGLPPIPLSNHAVMPIVGGL